MNDLTNLDSYKVFYLAARYQNITKAALQLGITQPSATKSIKKLEASLECSLLNRKSHGIALTEEGRILYEELEVAFSHLQTALDRLAERKALETGAIHLAVDSLLSRYLMNPVLERFRQSYPGIYTFVSKFPPLGLLEALEKGSVDLASLCLVGEKSQTTKRLRAAISKETFMSYPVATLRDDFIVGTRYAGLSEGTIPLSELARLPFIFPTVEAQPSDYYRKLLRPDGIPFPTDLAVSGSESRLALVQSNHGFTYFPSAALKPQLESGTLFWVQTEARMRQYHILALTSKEHLSSLVLSKLLPFLLSYQKKPS